MENDALSHGKILWCMNPIRKHKLISQIGIYILHTYKALFPNVNNHYDEIAIYQFFYNSYFLNHDAKANSALARWVYIMTIIQYFWSYTIPQYCLVIYFQPHLQ